MLLRQEDLLFGGPLVAFPDF
ncbi:uncharacterized protein FTOL_13340 [Fusarium torulosum]|uniref:Uncharacterized protein n=1 Tax=Fusarium torulosum TaxID=33205 RepID=A0AAE8MNK2_9HYPO|nr:uncharacterized protein FTOL_13340 [Fusarium torulosum]